MILPTTIGAAACPVSSRRISVGIWNWWRGSSALAAEKGCTPAQLALAWVLAQGNDIVPIPGTKRRRYLEENVGALDVHLTPDDLADIDADPASRIRRRLTLFRARHADDQSVRAKDADLKATGWDFGELEVRFWH